MSDEWGGFPAPETEPTTEPVTDAGDSPIIDPPAFDLSSLAAEDIPPVNESDFGTPNAKASRTPRTSRIFGRKEKSNDPTLTGRQQAAKARAAKSVVPNRKGQFIEPLTQLYAGIGMMLMPVDPICASAVIESGEQCAKALDDLAQKNDAVRRALWSLTQTSALTMVIVAHMPILMAVMIHHVPSAQNYMGSMGAAMAEQIREAEEAKQDDAA